jgi:phage repressor protein C with HTH and peptisase S24 domain
MTTHRTDPSAAASFMKRERRKRGWSTIQLADYARAIARREGSAIKLTQQSVSGFEQGDAKRMPEWFRYVEMSFEEGAPAKEQDTSARDDVVYVRQVDIRYAMGDGTAIDAHPPISLVPFNLEFIRRLSKAPVEQLFLASGIGNSMEPTLLKDDMVLVDTNETRSTFGDLLWAFEYAGAGYIKRLRRVKREGRELIEILSDNGSVPAELAQPEDIHIVGKVVWIARSM